MIDILRHINPFNVKIGDEVKIDGKTYDVVRRNVKLGEQTDIEIFLRERFKAPVHVKFHFEVSADGGCSGQNCHACANPCEKYIESLR